MRSLISLPVFLLLAGAPAAAQSPTFADIAWGTPAAGVKQQLARQGFTFREVDEDGDLAFEGALMGQEVQLWALLVRDSVQRIQVVLVTPDEEARPVYDDLRAALVKKYGEPTSSYETFQAPYEKGDGLEEEAIRLGKADISTRWVMPDGSGLAIEIGDKLVVMVEYEGPGWAAELKRRRQEGTRVF